ncbi:MAG: hypothetical protein JST34_16200 [Bacteroidetes bacterium]|nr:hypothetical protein [Bacteroidota bacterium]MBX2887991.1 hypothetical protein [Ferruginibacter sp.]
MDKANKIRIVSIIAALFMFLFWGCNFLDTDTQKIVGNLYVNYARSDSKGYILVVMDGSGLNDNISENYIQVIKGNDTVLVIKTIDRNNNSQKVFYELKHRKGYKPYSLQTINEEEYKTKMESIDDEYSFTAKAN